MHKLHKIVLSLVAVVALGSLAWATVGARLAATVIDLYNGGTLAYKTRVNSSGQYIVTDNVNGRTAFYYDDNTGGVGVRTRTTAQLGTLTPPAAGILMYDSTLGKIVFSTGTNIGAWSTY